MVPLLHPLVMLARVTDEMDSSDEHPGDLNEDVNEDANEDVEDDAEYENLYSDILSKSQNLLDEIELLQEYISKNKRYLPIEIRRFQTNIKSDMDFLHKVGLFYMSILVRSP